jgi:hypothetical protein
MNQRFSISPRPTKSLHLGYTPSELASSPYARYFKSDVPPLTMPAKDALLVGAQLCELFPDVKQARLLMESGYWPMETGYGMGLDGSVQVFALTKMPGLTPAIWDWWFAWHGSEAQRYQLWHPRAHVQPSTKNSAHISAGPTQDFYQSIAFQHLVRFFVAGTQALRKLFFPTAHAWSVGLGGFLPQCGFGWNSRNVGMGCQNVMGLDGKSS